MGKASRTKVDSSRREKIAAQRAAARRAEQRRRILIAGGSILAVIIVIVAFIVIKASSSPSKPTTTSSSANGPTGSALASVVAKVTSVPASTLNTVGNGVREIRIREAGGAFRVIYVAHFEAAIYVLHAFQKKTQKTSQSDVDLARSRLKAIGEER